MAATEHPALYHFHARGGKAEDTVRAWRTKQGENAQNLSFVEAFGGELADADGKLVLGKKRPFAKACPGQPDRSTAAKMLTAQKVRWKHGSAAPASARQQSELGGRLCSQIALTHLANDGDWVLVKNLKGNCPTVTQQPGEDKSLARVFILGQFDGPAAQWHTRRELCWPCIDSCGSALLAVRPVVWKRCGNWDALPKKIAKYLNDLSAPTAAEAKKSAELGCVQALIGASVEYERELMMPAAGGKYPDEYTRRLTPRKRPAAVVPAAPVKRAKKQQQEEEQEEEQQQWAADTADVQLSQTIAVPPTPEQFIADDDANLCVICVERPKTKILGPCGHRCLCDGCAATKVNWCTGKRTGLARCPICREDISCVLINGVYD